MTVDATAHVVVIGGGIACLSAAFFLRDENLRVTVLDGAPRLGGKLSASDVAGVAVDEGAEALLARRPEGIDLVTAVGLDGDLVPAGVTASAIYTRGAMRSLPRRQFMGVPADLDELAATGVVSPAGVARAREEPAGAAVTGDASVTEYIGSRLGAEVVDRLVDPLLGGVYAGRSEDLSFRATLAPLAAAAQGHATLTGAAASLLPPAWRRRAARRPRGRYWGQAGAGVRLADDRDRRAAGGGGQGVGRRHPHERHGPRAQAHADGLAAHRRLRRRPRVPGRGRGDPRHPRRPGRAAAEGQRGGGGGAARGDPVRVHGHRHARVPRGRFPAQQRSGYLVPAVDGRAVKAVTFSTVKWPHLAAQARAGEPVHVVRCSVGRSGDVAVLQRDDQDLAALAAAELAGAIGVTAKSIAQRVTRWGGGLPQYNVGHLDRVAAIRAAVAAQPGLAVVGAAYDGVGIPACVATARSAAAQVTAYLAGRGHAPVRDYKLVVYD